MKKLKISSKQELDNGNSIKIEGNIPEGFPRETLVKEVEGLLHKGYRLMTIKVKFSHRNNPENFIATYRKGI